jgi:hypothetical protein
MLETAMDRLGKAEDMWDLRESEMLNSLLSFLFLFLLGGFLWTYCVW